MKRLGIFLVALILAPAALFFGYVSLGFYEPDDLDLSSVLARLVVPSAIRQVPFVEPCAEPTVSKTLIECGGICGEKFDLRYETEADVAEVRDAVAAYSGAEEYDVDISSADVVSASGCRAMRISLSRMW